MLPPVAANLASSFDKYSFTIAVPVEQYRATPARLPSGSHSERRVSGLLDSARTNRFRRLGPVPSGLERIDESPTVEALLRPRSPFGLRRRRG